MPLKIQLKPNERIVINGAVIEGQSSSRTELVILNKARILRQKHIIQEEDAGTPAKRLYFALQMIYIDPDNIDDYLKMYEKYLHDLKSTVSLPPLVQSLSLIEAAVNDKKFYDAMKVCRKVMEVEKELLNIKPSDTPQKKSDETPRKAPSQAE